MTMATRQVEITGLKLAKFITWFIYAVMVLVVLLLTTAFILLLLGANPTAPFAAWVYRSTNKVMEPFRGIFGTIEGGTDSILDLSILFAIFIYGIIAIALETLVKWLDSKIRYFNAKARSEEEQARSRAVAPSVPPSGEALAQPVKGGSPVVGNS
jgi:uncharacterized protein YggT (Ycf19 family)